MKPIYSTFFKPYLIIVSSTLLRILLLKIEKNPPPHKFINLHVDTYPINSTQFLNLFIHSWQIKDCSKESWTKWLTQSKTIKNSFFLNFFFFYTSTDANCRLILMKAAFSPIFLTIFSSTRRSFSFTSKTKFRHSAGTLLCNPRWCSKPSSHFHPISIIMLRCWQKGCTTRERMMQKQKA